ncbi:hypothetical protein AaE_012322, partial [Aphanomyces astaci]
AFCLAVSLGVVGRGHVEASANAGKQKLPESGSETWVSIGDDGSRKAKATINIVEEERGTALSCDARPDGDCHKVLRPPVDAYPNARVAALVAGKAKDEVHTDGLPEMQALKRKGGRSKLAGALVVFGFFSAISFAVTSNVMSIYPSTKCFRIAGGNGKIDPATGLCPVKK